MEIYFFRYYKYSQGEIYHLVYYNYSIIVEIMTVCRQVFPSLPLARQSNNPATNKYIFVG